MSSLVADTADRISLWGAVTVAIICSFGRDSECLRGRPVMTQYHFRRRVERCGGFVRYIRASCARCIGGFIVMVGATMALHRRIETPASRELNSFAVANPPGWLMRGPLSEWRVIRPESDTMPRISPR